MNSKNYKFTRFGEFMREYEQNEALKIVKKNWNLSSLKYQIEVNDKFDHNLLDRILERTNMKFNEFGRKIQAGIDYIDKKNITKDIMIGIYYKKSDFTILFLVKPRNKYIRVSTVLDNSMSQKNTVRWEINEFNSQHGTNLNFSLNECGPDLDNSVLVEPWNNVSEVHFHCSDCFVIDL